MIVSAKSRGCLAILAIVSSIAMSANAQVSTHPTCGDNIKNARTFAALDENAFGDGINLQDGGLSSSCVDVSVPTNSGMHVAPRRKSVSGFDGGNTPNFNPFGIEWDLDVPCMMATYDSRDGWNAVSSVNGGPPSNSRCSSGTIRPAERVGPWPCCDSRPIYLHMSWKGIQVNIPGSGREQMLLLDAEQPLPADGKTCCGTTKSDWKIGCLPAVSNGQGEGFTVTTNDGITYHFDWMLIRKAKDLMDHGSVDANGCGYEPWHLLAPLTDVYLCATKVTDRFGNLVACTCDTQSRQRLTRIESSDGARIDVSYNADGLIASAKANCRT